MRGLCWAALGWRGVGGRGLGCQVPVRGRLQEARVGVLLHECARLALSHIEARGRGGLQVRPGQLPGLVVYVNLRRSTSAWVSGAGGRGQGGGCSRQREEQPAGGPGFLTRNSGCPESIQSLSPLGLSPHRIQCLSSALSKFSRIYQSLPTNLTPLAPSPVITLSQSPRLVPEPAHGPLPSPLAPLVWPPPSSQRGPFKPQISLVAALLSSHVTQRKSHSACWACPWPSATCLTSSRPLPLAPPTPHRPACWSVTMTGAL